MDHFLFVVSNDRCKEQVEACVDACASFLHEDQVHFIVSSPYVPYSICLNHALHYAVRELGVMYCSFFSLEISLSLQGYERLVSFLDPDVSIENRGVVFVGAYLHDCHDIDLSSNSNDSPTEFMGDCHEGWKAMNHLRADGLSIPWNTCSVWDVKALLPFGFSIMTEHTLCKQGMGEYTLHLPSNTSNEEKEKEEEVLYALEEFVFGLSYSRLLAAGTEEGGEESKPFIRLVDVNVGHQHMQQCLFKKEEENSSSSSSALDVVWKVIDFQDNEERREYHRKKMETKRKRSLLYQEYMDLTYGQGRPLNVSWVYHD